MQHDSTVFDFVEVVSELRRRLENGDALTFAEFLKQSPSFVTKLHEFLSTLQTADADLQRLFGFDEGEPDADDLRFPLPPTRPYVPNHADSPAEDSGPRGRIGNYELLERIARGGMGIVYKARQEGLDRVVALKTIRSGRLTTEAEIQRFRNEAQAAAVLRHPNIVPVYEYGVCEGQHYFTMEFVEGPSLAELLRTGPLDPTTAAQHVSDIARTIQYAHSQGIIHRDLKPSNVLVAAGNQLRITDFGVAKSVGEEGTICGVGQIVGTPSYMSPEQSLGAKDAASPRADVYSLGAVLYALLTARPPFLAATEIETLIQLRTQDPVPPRSLNPDIPLDLEVICLKCLRKDPQQRYATADELADDLDRYLQGQSIVARPLSWVERAVQSCRRNPGFAALLGVSAIAAVLFVAALTQANFRLNSLNRQLNASLEELALSNAVTHAALEEAELSQAQAAQLLYVADLKEAGRALYDGDARLLPEILERQRPLPGQRDYRGGEWDFLSSHARTSYETVLGVEAPQYAVCFTPDGTHIAASGQDAVIRVVAAAGHKLLVQFDTGQIEVNGLAFAADGRTLASSGDDGTVRLWAVDWERRQVRHLRTIRAHAQQVYDVGYALGGQLLVSSGRESVIGLWDPATGESQGTLVGHNDTVAGISVSADGQKLASASHDGLVILWDLLSRNPLRTISTHTGKLTSVSFSGDATLVATSSVGRKVQVWSTETGHLVHEFEHLDRVERCAFTPDGSTVIACDHGGMIRIWELSPTETPAQFIPGVPVSSGWRAHPDRIYSVVVSPNAKRLISAGADGKVLAWNLSSERPSTELQKSDRQIVDMAFVPGRDLLATIDAHSIELWQPRNLSLMNALWHSDQTFRCLAVSADGSTLATGSDAGRVDVWDLALGRPRATLHVRPDFMVDGLALSPDGSTVAAIERYVSEWDDLCVLDVASGQRLAGIAAPSCNSAAFSPDGRSLFASGPANVVAVWDLHSQQKVSEQSAHVSSINRIQFSADGRYAATASDDRLVKIWTTHDWKNIFVLSGHLNAVRSLAFAPDGLTLASAGSDGRLKFWNLPTGQELFELKTAPVSPELVSFSSDGRFLACLYSDPTPEGRQQLHVLAWRSDRQ